GGPISTAQGCGRRSATPREGRGHRATNHLRTRRQRPSASELHRPRRTRARGHRGRRGGNLTARHCSWWHRRGRAWNRKAETKVGILAAQPFAARRDARREAGARPSWAARAGEHLPVTVTRFASVVLDVDSTLCGIEGIDVLAMRRGPEVGRRIAEITDRAMRGEIALERVYGERL